MNIPSYASEPQVLLLSQLLDEIAEGHIRIPQFQRPMVWSDEQRLDLMRSVSQSIPFGSLVVWRTHERLACFETLGPYRLDLGAAGNFFSYLLDGLQRMATLFGALQTPKQKELALQPSENDDTCWEIVYDLQEEEFFLAKDAQGHHVVSMRVVLDSIERMRFHRALTDHPHADELLDRLDRLAAPFQTYKVVIIPFVTDDLDRGAQVFQRVNSQGTSLSQVHVLNALTLGGGSSFLQKVEELREEHLAPLGWRDLGDSSILMACKLALNLDLYEGDLDIVSRELRKASDVFRLATSRLIEGIQFLGEHCGIRSPKLLPYEPLLPLLAHGLAAAPRRDESMATLFRHWFWWTTYIGFAGGANTSSTRKAREHIQTLARGEEPSEQMRAVTEIPPPPRRYDFRHARSKVLALHMARHREEVEGGASIVDRLNEDGADMIQMLVPRSRARKMGALDFDQLDSLLRSTANRVVATSKDMEPLWHGEELDDQTVEAHLIPSPVPETMGGLQVFLEERRRRLDALEQKFLSEMRILAPAGNPA